MHTWTDFVTTETFDAHARATLDILFSQDKRGVDIGNSCIVRGLLMVDFRIPFSDWTKVFVVFMEPETLSSRHPIHFPNVAPPLADAIKVELVLIFFKKIHMTVARYGGMCATMYIPIIKLALQLCETNRITKKNNATRKARLLQVVSMGAERTGFTAEDLRVIRGITSDALSNACLLRIASATFLGICLMRWKSRAIERMYAPEGRGAYLAHRSFQVHALMQQRASITVC